MKLAKILLFVVIAFVLTALGFGLMAAGVHGPRVATYVGTFLILPSLILMKLGVPIAIPFLYRTTVISTALFCALQLGYYYGLLRLLAFVVSRSREKTLTRRGA